MKKIIATIFVIIFGLVIYFSYQHLTRPAPTMVMPQSDAAPVNVTTVQLSDIPQQIIANGSLNANQSVEISSEYAGWVAKILFTDGETVKANQALIQLDTVDAKLQLQSAEAGLKLDLSVYKRYQQLAGVISKNDLDKALSDLQQQEATAAQMKNQLNKMLLRAPFAGTLTSRTVDVGQYIAVGQALVQLVDSSQLKVAYQVPEAQVAKLAVGQTVSIISNAYPQQIFQGKAVYLAPALDPATRSLEVHAVIPNSEHKLKPGMFVMIQQNLGMLHNVVTVPLQALVASIDGNYVYQVVNNKAVQTFVTVGLRTGTNAEILSGLKAGDVIITAGQQNLRDGMPVKVVS